MSLSFICAVRLDSVSPPVECCISSDISGKLIWCNLVQPAWRTHWPLAVCGLKHTPPLCNQALTHYSHICTASNLCPAFPWMRGLDWNNLIYNVPVSPDQNNSPAHPRAKSYSVPQRLAFVIKCQVILTVPKLLIHPIWAPMQAGPSAAEGSFSLLLQPGQHLLSNQIITLISIHWRDFTFLLF